MTERHQPYVQALYFLMASWAFLSFNGADLVWINVDPSLTDHVPPKFSTLNGECALHGIHENVVESHPFERIRQILCLIDVSERFHQLFIHTCFHGDAYHACEKLITIRR